MVKKILKIEKLITLKKFFKKYESFDVTYLELRVELILELAFSNYFFWHFAFFKCFFVKLYTFETGGGLVLLIPYCDVFIDYKKLIQ